MALQEQNIPVSFSKGLNTKTDPKQTMPGSLLTLANGVFTKVNAINQDPGYLPLPTLMYNTIQMPEFVTVGNSLSTFNGQLILTDSTFLYNYSELYQQWVQTPTKIATTTTSLPVGSNSIGTSSIGVAQHSSGVELYTYLQLSTDIGGIAGQLSASGVYTTLFDPTNGTILYNNVFEDASLENPNGAYPDSVYSAVIGNVGYAIYSTNITGVTSINYLLLGIAVPPENLASTLLITTANSVNNFSIAQNTTNLYVLYMATGGLTLASFTGGSALALVTSVIVPGGAPAAWGLSKDPSGNLIVTFQDGTDLKAATYTPALTPITGSTIVGNVIPAAFYTTSIVSGGLLWVYVQQTSVNNASGNYYDVSVNTTTYPTLNPGASQLVELIFNTYLSTQAYIFNSQPTVNVGFYDFTTPIGGITALDQSEYFTITQAPPLPSTNTNYKLQIPYTVIAKFAEGAAGSPLSPFFHYSAALTQVLTLSNTQTIIPYLNNTNVEIDSGVTVNQFNVARMTETYGLKTRTSTLGNNLSLTGGVLSIYDGVGIAETGFNVYPSQTQAAFTSELVTGTPPPSLTGGSTYSYVNTYEWTDNYGNLHRSSPGPATTGPAAANVSGHVSQAVVTVNGTSLSESYKIFNIQVVLWRTAGNGTIYYRIASKPNVAGVISFTDSKPDASITASTQLYTTGGEVDNIAPPSTSLIFPYKNRMIAVDANNPYVWWYSKQVIQGFPVEFSDFFTANIDMTGGPISAGQTMDDKLIFFKDSAIFYVIGDGPAPSGTANDFSYPQVITSDVGCTNQDSIIVIPIGLMFQSTDKGIYLLDRNLQVSYIGAAVEQFNNIPVTSSVLLPNTTQVRFTLSSGTILIYDYAAQQWSTHTNLSFNDSTIYRSMHSGLQPNGQVLEQTQGQWIDITTPDALSLTTGWFEFANLQGYQRVIEILMLLTSVNATSLLIQVYMDFDTTTAINNDLIQVPANTMRQQYRIFPAFQKGQAMQIKITEIPTGAQAGGLLLSGLSFIAGIKKGNNKVSGDRNYG